MAVSLTQNVLSPAQYEDRMDNVINQGNTANNSECNGCVRKNTENKESSHRDPASQGRATELMQTGKTSATICTLILNSKQFFMPF